MENGEELHGKNSTKTRGYGNYPTPNEIKHIKSRQMQTLKMFRYKIIALTLITTTLTIRKLRINIIKNKIK